MASLPAKGRTVRFHILKDDEEEESQGEDSRVVIAGDSSDDAEENGNNSQNVQLLFESGEQAPSNFAKWTCGKRNGKCRNMKELCRVAVVLLSVALLVSVFVAVLVRLSENEQSRKNGDAGNPKSEMLQHNTPSLLSLYCRQSDRRSVPKLTYSGSCSSLTLNPKWENHFANMTSESAIRFIDINCDGTLDVILGFGVLGDNPDGRGFPFLHECLFSNSSLRFCLGGIVALDGRTGKELWRKRTVHEIFAINCVLDVNRDGQVDCIVTGRGGTFFSIEPRTAEILWMGDKQVTNFTWNIMTAQIVKDFDEDGVQDIIVSHGGDTRYDAYQQPRGIGRLLLVSGQTGNAISFMSMPDRLETYMTPIIHRGVDGKERVLFGSGGESIPGSLWSVELDDFAQLGSHCGSKSGVLDCNLMANSTRKVVQGIRHRGASNPPALVDLTGDGVLDIVMPMYDGRVFALNGRDFSEIWKRVDFGESESYMYPAIGRFNNDDTPDIMAMYQRGEYLKYNATMTAIIDGRTGNVSYYDEIPVGMRMAPSPLVLQTTTGEDWFLYWKPKATSSIFNTSPARRRRHGDEGDDQNDDNGDDRRQWHNDVQFLAKSSAVKGHGWVLLEEQTGFHKSEYANIASLLTMKYGLISTPSITDLDGDGRLDLVYAYFRNVCPLPKNLHLSGQLLAPFLTSCRSTSLDIFVKEVNSDCPFAQLEHQQWLGYLGTYGDGIYGM